MREWYQANESGEELSLSSEESDRESGNHVADFIEHCDLKERLLLLGQVH